MPPVFKTTGGVVRWIIRDMRANPGLWVVNSAWATRPWMTPQGEVYSLEVSRYQPSVKLDRAEQDGGIKHTVTHVLPGLFRRLRLKLATHRLAATKLAEVLP